METVTDFIFLGSKTTMDGDCSHEIKRCLLLGRKAMTNLDNILKSLVWMWELDYKESWAPKNWCFWTVVLKKTLESPLDCKEIHPVHSKGDQSWVFFRRNDAKLKLQCFGHLLWRVDLLEKTPMLGGIGGRRKRGWQRMRWPDGISDLMDLSLSELREWWWTGKPGMMQFMGSQRVGHDWVTELNHYIVYNCKTFFNQWH